MKDPEYRAAYEEAEQRSAQAMTSADDAVVLDVLVEMRRYSPFEDVGDFPAELKCVLDALRAMPDKGPLARSLGITPSDLGLIELLREALPWIDDEARRWDENSGEAVNLRLRAQATELAERIRYWLGEEQ